MKKHLRLLRQKSYVLVLCMLMTAPLTAQTYLDNFFSVHGGFVTIEGVSYFFATSTQGESGLWKTDGTQRGTEMVKPISIGHYNSKDIFVYQNELYFSAVGISGQNELWKSDGTEFGTHTLRDASDEERAIVSPSNFMVYDNILYFEAKGNTSNQRTIYRTDGTPEGTGKATNIVAPDASGSLKAVANGKLYFSSIGILQETDGTMEGTKNNFVDGLAYSGEYHSFGSGLYFITHNYNKTYIRLYRLTDINNYTMIKEFSTQSHYGLELYGLAEIDGKVVFSVVSGETYSSVKDTLWVTDGTPEGTTELISHGNRHLWFRPNYSGFVSYRGELYFNAGPATENALWKTDGTKEGTVEVNKDAHVNNEAPMHVLNDKLYFLNGTSLHTYDGSLQETNQVWQLRSARKSTGDDYFVKSDGRYIYAMVRNLWDDDANNMDFFHTGKNPLMQVSVPYGFFKQETLKFDAKVDSVVIKEISIKNIGNANLAFSKVHVSGEGFYINGETKDRRYGHEGKTEFPQQLAPDNRGVFQIGFLPGSSGAYTGHLIIRSNDTSRPEYRLELRGYASDIPPNSINATFPTEKEIKWNKIDSQIDLDVRSVSEQANIGSVVGTFSNNLLTESFTYELVAGEGSEDNNVFNIVNDQLIVGDDYHDNQKNAYTIRVGVNDHDGGDIEEVFVISVNEESVELPVGDCSEKPISLTTELVAVDFLNDTDAIAVGNLGVVLKTEDKGSTWSQIDVIERSNRHYSGELFEYLNHVQFVNENTGFLAGGYTLLRTDNAGRNWKPLEFDGISNYGVFGFFAVSADMLYVIKGNKLYKSDDGGQSWFEVLVSGIYEFKTIYFYNDSIGFISDNSKYSVTKDGGKTWETYELNEEAVGRSQAIVDFSFIDEKIGYAVVENGKVLQTLDGGVTWAVINSENKNRIRQIEFTDADHGYLVGSQVHETTDGGVSWVAVPYDTMWSVNQIATNSAGDKIAVGGGDYGIGRNIYQSLEAGTWSNISEYRGDEARRIYIGTENIYVLSDNFTRMSSDNGVTWQDWNIPMEGKSFATQSNGDTFIMGLSSSDEFYRSTDGGLSWSPLARGDQMGSYNIIDESTIVSVNSEGNILKSNDLGDTWSNLSIAPERYNGYLDFLDEFIGIMYSHEGFARTLDGGLTWQEFPVDIEDIYIYRFKFVNSQIGVFSSNRGFFRTNDGGQTWMSMDLNVEWSRKIVMVDEAKWYIAARSTVYTTLDGGITWQNLITASDEITTIEFVDDMLYFGLRDGNVFQLSEEERPIDAGYIKGDKVVRVGDQEIYTVAKHSDNNYVWTVSGSNNMVSEDNFARVTWNEPGTYTLEVTPYGSCSTGTPETITVEVYGKMAPPEINGPDEVVEGSNGIVYTTPEEEQVRYIWSVTGQRSFHANDNTITVDWGTIGQQEIGLIKTDLVSGMRAYSRLDVNVLPSDPFTILQIDASCRDTPNGSLQIASRLPAVSYEATLTTTGYSYSQEFSNQTLFENLAIGVYDLCIDELNTDRSYCYQFTIAEPEPFEVASKKVSGAVKKVSLQFKGGAAPYTILVNGRFIAETSQSQYELTAADDDVLEVLTSGDCAFSYSEVLNFNRNIAVSPNPVITSFKAILGKDFSQEVKSIPISFFNSAGHLAFRTMAHISNHTLECDVTVLPSGIYMAQVGDERQVSFKIIKQ